MLFCSLSDLSFKWIWDWFIAAGVVNRFLSSFTFFNVLQRILIICSEQKKNKRFLYSFFFFLRQLLLYYFFLFSKKTVIFERVYCLLESNSINYTIFGSDRRKKAIQSLFFETFVWNTNGAVLCHYKADK